MGGTHPGIPYKTSEFREKQLTGRPCDALSHVVDLALYLCWPGFNESELSPPASE